MTDPNPQLPPTQPTRHQSILSSSNEHKKKQKVRATHAHFGAVSVNGSDDSDHNHDIDRDRDGNSDRNQEKEPGDGYKGRASSSDGSEHAASLTQSALTNRTGTKVSASPPSSSAPELPSLACGDMIESDQQRHHPSFLAHPCLVFSQHDKHNHDQDHYNKSAHAGIESVDYECNAGLLREGCEYEVKIGEFVDNPPDSQQWTIIQPPHGTHVTMHLDFKKVEPFNDHVRVLANIQAVCAGTIEEELAVGSSQLRIKCILRARVMRKEMGTPVQKPNVSLVRRINHEESEDSSG